MVAAEERCVRVCMHVCVSERERVCVCMLPGRTRSVYVREREKKKGGEMSGFPLRKCVLIPEFLFLGVFLKYGIALSMRQAEKHPETYSGEREPTEEGGGRSEIERERRG